MTSVMNTDCEAESDSETNTNILEEENEAAAGEEEEKGVNLGVSEETKVSSMEIDSGGLEGEVADRVLKSERSEEVRVRLGLESEEMVSRVCKVEQESAGFDRLGAQNDKLDVKYDGFNVGNNQFDLQNGKLEVESDRFDVRKDLFGAQNDQIVARNVRFRVENDQIEAQIKRMDDPKDQFGAQNELFEARDEQLDAQDDQFDDVSDQTEHMVAGDDRHVEVEKGAVYTSLLFEFDEYVASEKNGVMGSGTSRALSYGFEVGDMVWGKVKSHPWWPGRIFSEAFASSSVRRTRRNGHVLVAFFGDNSYGWFDPAELIQFDVNFAEKARQTNSKNFVKAVEEAMEEASRRRGLGLVCKCRNQYNFRPTGVEGYYAVDVPDYEPGKVYSANEIRKARDCFRADETLLRMKSMALAPCDTDQNSLDFVMNKATIFAFRKAMFEEFDETYSQAFGVQAARPSQHSVDMLDRPVKKPAPLSGRLVIAETLGSRKSSTKSMKVKDHSKKDRYLFKRRDELSSSNTQQINQGQPSSSLPSACVEGSPATAVGDYVLQKRAPSVSVRSASSSQDASVKVNVTIDQASPHRSSLPTQGGTLDAKPSLDKKGVLQDTKEGMGFDVWGPGSADSSNLSGKGVVPGVIDGAVQTFQQEGQHTLDFRQEDSLQMSRSYDRVQQPGSNISTRMEGGRSDQVQDGHGATHPSPINAKHSGGMSADGGVKKVKVRKRPMGKLTSDISIMGEKMKKKKKEPGSETSSVHPHKSLAAGKGGKSTQIGVASREDYQKKEDSTSNLMSDSVGALPVGMGNVELPQLLSDLQALALNPFHGVERKSPAIIKQFFLRYRSIAYQKSLLVAPPSDTEPGEVHATKSPATFAASDNPPGENVRDFPSSKPVKKTLSRPDDPTKAGRKRGPSDRQEGIAAKKLKKIKDVKSLAVDKKASLKNSEPQQREGKESVGPGPPRPVKPDSIKKAVAVAAPAAASKAAEPTMLVMKFPPETSLPSGAELKARLARFGPIDQSSIRVFWKSFTCRVVFQHKIDAHTACKYLNGNTSLFGNVSLRCHIRPVEDPAPEAPESVKIDTNIETPRVKNLAVEQRPVSSTLPYQSLQQPAAVQLKSCLKKPSGEDPGQLTGGGNGGRGTPRVKFMLGGEESSRNNNFNNNNNINNNGSSSVALDFNSKNFHKVVPSALPPILPLPPQYANASLNNMHHTEALAPRIAHNLNNTPTTTTLPTASTIDISQQMLSLLSRCNDVVSNVSGMFGYVPYHPL